jgi:hypothetical protein
LIFYEAPTLDAVGSLFLKFSEFVVVMIACETVERAQKAATLRYFSANKFGLLWLLRVLKEQEMFAPRCS